jgi:hypothetical protein
VDKLEFVPNDVKLLDTQLLHTSLRETVGRNAPAPLRVDNDASQITIIDADIVQVFFWLALQLAHSIFSSIEMR